MQVRLSNIPDDGLNLRFSRGGDWFFKLLSRKDRCDFSLDRIDINCQLNKIREKVDVKGEIVTEFDLECCRCLDRFKLPVKVEFEYTFSPDPGCFDEDLELSHEELGMNYYSDSTIDIDDIIVEQIILQVPISPLCKESCKGLCKICGINLNVVECGHKVETKENAFAKLKDFKIEKGMKQ
ncbi:MAG: DUF177 domain-containing protein [Deltaproteobacteria bacterium]|nr:DUF177 domain-containing protein [Deltaproteobacteria bacterium]